MVSDTYDMDILSRSGVIWIIHPCYKLVLMSILWYICEGLGVKFPRATRLQTWRNTKLRQELQIANF
jgi:hypothetical protein